MNTDWIKDGIVVLVALICGYYVLTYAPTSSFYYKALITLNLIYICVMIYELQYYIRKGSYEDR